MPTKNLFTEICRDFPDHAAIVESGNRYTYAELLGAIDRCAASLGQAGVRPGDRVGCQLEAGRDLLIAFYAAFSIGASAVPLPRKDMDRFDGARRAAGIKVVLSDIATPHVLGDETAPGPGNDGVSADEALILFTSGTTSASLKGVRLAHSSISAVCSFMNRAMGIDRSVVELIYAPLDHAYAFGRCHSVLSVGGTVVLPDSFVRLGELFELIEGEDCNALAIPPSILASVLKIAQGPHLELLAKKIAWVQSGAMRFSAFYRQKLLDALPDTRIFLHYGLSEAMRATFFELNAHRDKIHTEGPASDGMEIQILDADHKPVAQGTEGLIAVKGSNLCLGYLDDALWRSTLRDGWHITSDRGVLDPEGFLEFRGRADDVININGLLVHPDEIETKIVPLWPEHALSVVGTRDPSGVKDVVIVLCFKEPSPVSGLRDVKKRLKGVETHFMPQHVMSFPALPSTRTGKVDRNKLRQMIKATWDAEACD
ncbi:MAG: class I adenylate-forming enzyme family protein [Magnetovibrionaceae bacterium]